MDRSRARANEREQANVDQDDGDEQLDEREAAARGTSRAESGAANVHAAMLRATAAAPAIMATRPTS
jgi:hypothetical protein